MKNIKLTLVGLVGLLAFSTAALAQFTYNIQLSGDEEVPPVDTPGSGTAFGSLDPDTNILTWNVTFQDLTSGLTLAHFHGPAEPGEGAGVLVNMSPPSSVLGETSGNWSGQAEVTSETTRQHILDHLTYINLHTDMHGGGELRGQVVPEPSTYALIAGIFTLVGVCVWRRRSRR